MKKGLSTVISVMLLVLLTVVIVGVVWAVVSNLVDDKLDEANCLDVIGKVSINYEFTCYNATGLGYEEMKISIGVGDIEIDEIVVSLTSFEIGESFSILKEDSTSAFVRSAKGNYGEAFKLPSKNGAVTYVYNVSKTSIGKPGQIEVSPKIGESQCSVADSLREIYYC